MLAGPKNLATSPAVGGTVDRNVRPITAANTSITTSGLGRQQEQQHRQRARGIDRSDSNDFMRQRPTAQPIAMLPTMLNRPSIASDQAPYCTGRPQDAMTPGRWVPRKAT